MGRERGRSRGVGRSVIGRCRPGESVGPFRLDTNTGCMDLGLGQVIGGAALLKFYEASVYVRKMNSRGRDSRNVCASRRACFPEEQIFNGSACDRDFLSSSPSFFVLPRIIVSFLFLSVLNLDCPN